MWITQRTKTGAVTVGVGPILIGFFFAVVVAAYFVGLGVQAFAKFWFILAPLSALLLFLWCRSLLLGMRREAVKTEEHLGHQELVDGCVRCLLDLQRAEKKEVEDEARRQANERLARYRAGN